MFNKDGLKTEIRLSSAQKYLLWLFAAFASIPIVIAAIAGRFVPSTLYFVFSPFFMVLYFIATVGQFHLPLFLDINALFFGDGKESGVWFGAGALLMVAPAWIALGVKGRVAIKNETENPRLISAIRFLSWFLIIVGTLAIVVPFALGWYSMWTGKTFNF